MLVQLIGRYNNILIHKLLNASATKCVIFLPIGFLPISRGEGKEEEKESLFRGRHSVNKLEESGTVMNIAPGDRFFSPICI